jgi:hypothetical protein
VLPEVVPFVAAGYVAVAVEAGAPEAVEPTADRESAIELPGVKPPAGRAALFGKLPAPAIEEPV